MQLADEMLRQSDRRNEEERAQQLQTQRRHNRANWSSSLTSSVFVYDLTYFSKGWHITIVGLSVSSVRLSLSNECLKRGRLLKRCSRGLKRRTNNAAPPFLVSEEEAGGRC